MACRGIGGGWGSVAALWLTADRQFETIQIILPRAKVLGNHEATAGTTIETKQTDRPVRFASRK